MSNRILVIDYFRGIASLLVVLSHIREILFGVADLTNILYYPFYFITGLGHESVMIFFVISGFLVGGRLYFNKDNIKFKKYFINRIIRLYIVLIPALILTFIVGLFLYKSTDLTNLFLDINSVKTHNFSIGICSFIGNLFFLQNGYVNVFGGNGPLWSLANEFWYYIIFPISLMLLSKKKYILLAIFILSHLFLLKYDINKYYPIWILGSISYYFYNRNFKIGNNYILFSFLVISLFLAKSHLFETIISDYIIGIITAILLINKFEVKSNKVIIFLSNISYSLYLTHFPVMMFLYFLNSKYIISTNRFYLFFIFVIVTLLVGYIFYYLFEKNTEKIKKIFLNIFNYD